MSLSSIMKPGDSISFLPDSNPTFYEVYEWEKFDFVGAQNWMKDYWWVSGMFVFSYLALILIGRKMMEKRSPMKKKGILALWNLFHSAFATLAFLRTMPEMIFLLSKPNGFHTSVCSRNNLTIGTAYWIWIGTLSKVMELGDTAFIILKKQPLIFLHWYHHATVMLYTWVTYGDNDPSHRWFMVMNYFVHSLMYAYFFLKSLKVSVPKFVAMTITTLQILQMIIGIGVNFYALFALGLGRPCEREAKNVHLAILMYLSYLALFARFFSQSYFQKRKID